MGDDFLDTIKISLVPDEKEYQKTLRLMQNLKTMSGVKGLDDSTKRSLEELNKKVLVDAKQIISDNTAELQNLLKQVNEGTTNLLDVQDRINELRESINNLTDATKEEQDKLKKESNTSRLLEQVGKSKIVDNLSQKITNKLQSIGEEISDKIKETFEDAWRELDNILSYSRYSNSTREQAFTYGFTPGENYAFSKAMSLMGLENEEDLWYMTDAQWNRFSSQFEKYTEKYNKLYDAGFFNAYEEYTWSIEELKEDLQLSVMQFFVDNKDLITTSLEAIVDVSSFVIDTLGSILKFFSSNPDRTEAQRAADIAQIMNNHSVKSTNIKMENTFNNTNESKESWFINSIGSAAEQIITALGG